MEWGSSQIGFYTPPAQMLWLSRPDAQPAGRTMAIRAPKGSGVEDVAFGWRRRRRRRWARNRASDRVLFS